MNTENTLSVVPAPAQLSLKKSDIRKRLKAENPAMSSKSLTKAVNAELDRIQPVADAYVTDLSKRGYRIEKVSESKTGLVSITWAPPSEDTALSIAEAKAAKAQAEADDLRAIVERQQAQIDRLFAASTPAPALAIA